MPLRVEGVWRVEAAFSDLAVAGSFVALCAFTAGEKVWMIKRANTTGTTWAGLIFFAPEKGANGLRNEMQKGERAADTGGPRCDDGWLRLLAHVLAGVVQAFAVALALVALAKIGLVLLALALAPALLTLSLLSLLTALLAALLALLPILVLALILAGLILILLPLPRGVLTLLSLALIGRWITLMVHCFAPVGK